MTIVNAREIEQDVEYNCPGCRKWAKGWVAHPGKPETHAICPSCDGVFDVTEHRYMVDRRGQRPGEIFAI